MNTSTDPHDQVSSHADVSVSAKKLYTPPSLRREASVALVTAGSFDLIIPGGV